MPLVDMFSHINALKPWNPNHEIMSGLVHVNLPDFGRQAFREAMANALRSFVAIEQWHCRESWTKSAKRIGGFGNGWGVYGNASAAGPVHHSSERLIKTQILLAENLLEQGVGGALSNGIVGFIAVAAGMTGDATAADMTAANIHTFEVCAFYVPLDLIVLSLLVFMFKVKINEKIHAEIVEQLEAKLAAGEIPDEEVKTVETVEASTRRPRF